MRYAPVLQAEFVVRHNRFVASVILNGETIQVHVKNTGRCKEILIPGTRVVLWDSCNPTRKYRYDLIAAYKGNLLINIDSQAPNQVFAEYVSESGFFGKDTKVMREHTIGDSRFDFYAESDDRRIVAEVKGVTYEEEGICSFPDAPTERGRKHLRGLIQCVKEGYEAYAIFVVQMQDMKVFEPDELTDPKFAEELRHAHASGVNIVCLGCTVEDDSLWISYEIPFRLRSQHFPLLRLVSSGSFSSRILIILMYSSRACS